MPERKIYMPERETIKKFLKSPLERDFSNIRFQEDIDLTLDPDILMGIIENFSFYNTEKNEPINFTNSDFIHLKFPGMYIPFSNLRKTNFAYSELINSVMSFGFLQYANFSRAKLNDSNFFGTNCSNAIFNYSEAMNVDFSRSFLGGTCLIETRLDGSILERAKFDHKMILQKTSFIDSKGLEKVSGLELPIYTEVKMDEKQRKILINSKQKNGRKVNSEMFEI